MYKNILFILLITIAGIVSTIVFQRGGESATPDSQPVEQETAETASVPSQEQNGIEAIIENMDQLDDSTVITLGLSNHRYDLGESTAYEQATLNGQPSLSHTFLSNAVGGHHVEVKIVFEKTTNGSFQITPVEGTTFTFDDLW